MLTKLKWRLSYALLACLLVFVSLGGVGLVAHFSAAASSSSTPNLATLQKNCAVLEIHLHSTQQPATNCLHAHMPAGTRSLARAHPAGPDAVFTYYDGTCDSYTEMVIWYDSYTYEACFAGTGYLGYSLNYVTEVDNISYTTDEWIKYYNPGGNYCTIYAGNSGFFNQVYITQLDIGGSNGPSC